MSEDPVIFSFHSFPNLPLFPLLVSISLCLFFCSYIFSSYIFLITSIFFFSSTPFLLCPYYLFFSFICFGLSPFPSSVLILYSFFSSSLHFSSVSCFRFFLHSISTSHVLPVCLPLRSSSPNFSSFLLISSRHLFPSPLPFLLPSLLIHFYHSPLPLHRLTLHSISFMYSKCTFYFLFTPFLTVTLDRCIWQVFATQACHTRPSLAAVFLSDVSQMLLSPCSSSTLSTAISSVLPLFPQR